MPLLSDRTLKNLHERIRLLEAINEAQGSVCEAAKRLRITRNRVRLLLNKTSRLPLSCVCGGSPDVLVAVVLCFQCYRALSVVTTPKVKGVGV